MSSAYLLGTIFAMAAVTFLSRALPDLIPKSWLDRAWVHRLNASLPFCVLILLLLSNLNILNANPLALETLQRFGVGGLSNDWQEISFLLAQIAAIWVVLITYHIWRNLLICMIVGVAVLNLILLGLQSWGA